MEKIKFVFIGIAAGIIGIICLYFFYFIPEKNDAFEKGKQSCEKQIDTVTIPGKTIIKYRDTSFHHSSPVIVQEKDSSINYSTKFDSSFVSFKDSIYFKAEVQIIKGLKNDIRSIWDVHIKHRNFQKLPDTVKIYTPKYIKETKIETNWMISFIAYVCGILSAIAFLIFSPHK